MDAMESGIVIEIYCQQEPKGYHHSVAVNDEAGTLYTTMFRMIAT